MAEISAYPWVAPHFPWAASAVEAAHGLLTAASGDRQRVAKGNSVGPGGRRLKKKNTHGQLLITHGLLLQLKQPMGY